jgi:hypothetical protein
LFSIYNAKLLQLLPGSQTTPDFIPASSPNDRVMANPGRSILGIQTLSGPTYLPRASFYLSILPPKSIILYLSIIKEGLWSLDKGMDFQSL